MEVNESDIVTPENVYDDLNISEGGSGEYKSYIRHKVSFIVFCLFLLFVIVVVGASIGAIDIPFLDVLGYILRFDNSGLGRIVWDVRMMRIVACILVGATLAVAGTVMQSVLRNPLASPYTLGLSGAAAFGAAFGIVVLQGGSMASSSVVVDNPYIVTMSAFFFSMVAVAVIVLLTKITRVTSETMVLAGVAVSAIFTAALSLMQFLASSNQLSNIVSWSFGNMALATWRWDIMVFIVLVPAVIYFFYNRWNYNAMDSGEDTAKGLGVHTESLRIIGMIVSSLICAVAISFFGIIAFIGLLAPHISRMIIGGDHRYLIPASLIVGSIILTVSDILAMNLIDPIVLPAGIITSMLGGPMFIYLLVRGSRR